MLEQLRGEPIDRDQIEPLTRQMAEIADSTSATDFLIALDYLRRISREIIRFWEGYDLLVTPTLTTPAVELGEHEPGPDEEPVRRLLDAGTWVPFTPVWNVTGQPAISLPLAQSEAGLPIGVQFVGAPAAEETLLSVASQLEQARPWADRTPPVFAA